MTQINYKIEECVWKNFIGVKKREVESQYGCNKCSARESDCKSYIPKSKYMKEVGKLLLEGRL